jgi:hypothetical protein
MHKILLLLFLSFAGHQCLKPVVLAIWEAEIRRITVQNQPGKIIHKTLSRKNPPQKRARGVARGIGLSSSPSTKKWEEKPKHKRKQETFGGDVHLLL